MAYVDDWTGKGWLVKTVNGTKITNKEIEVGDRLTFKGKGDKADASVVKRKDKDGNETTWAKECECLSVSPETVIMQHDDLGECSMWFSAPKELSGDLNGGPEGAAWTAEDDGPP